MSRYLDGELIRVEPGREGSPVSHIVWDSYAGREVRIYVKPKEWQALSPEAQRALTEMAGNVRESMDARAAAQREAIERVRNAALAAKAEAA